jgi:regulatory protein
MKTAMFVRVACAGICAAMGSDKKITDFKPLKRKKTRFEIFLDGEPAAEVDVEVIVRLKLRKGAVVDDRLLEGIRREDERLRARRAALRLLLLRPRSRKELFFSLVGKRFNEGVIDDVLDQLEAEGKIHEADFAARFVRDRLKLKPAGPHKLAAELRARGIDADTIKVTLARNFPPEKQRSTALALVHKKFPAPHSQSVQTRSKIFSFLYQRGFDEETVNRVLEHLNNS